MIFQVDICFLAAPVFPHKQFYPLPCALLCCGQFRRPPAGKIRTFASTELGREIFVPYLLKRKNWVSLGTNLSFQPEAIFVEGVTKAIMFRHSRVLMSLFRSVWHNAPVRETVKRFISDSRPAFLVAKWYSFRMEWMPRVCAHQATFTCRLAWLLSLEKAEKNVAYYVQ